MKTFHLLNDLGVYKSTIRKNFEDNDRGPELNHVRDLLDRKTQRYTVDELRELFGFLWTAHDDCVAENQDEFSQVEIFTSLGKIERGVAAMTTLNELAGEEVVLVP